MGGIKIGCLVEMIKSGCISRCDCIFKSIVILIKKNLYFNIMIVYYFIVLNIIVVSY